MLPVLTHGRGLADVDDVAEEIGKRIRDLDSGAVTPVPWFEARRMIPGR